MLNFKSYLLKIFTLPRYGFDIRVFPNISSVYFSPEVKVVLRSLSYHLWFYFVFLESSNIYIFISSKAVGRSINLNFINTFRKIKYCSNENLELQLARCLISTSFRFLRKKLN